MNFRSRTGTITIYTVWTLYDECCIIWPLTVYRHLNNYKVLYLRQSPNYLQHMKHAGFSSCLYWCSSSSKNWFQQLVKTGLQKWDCHGQVIRFPRLLHPHTLNFVLGVHAVSMQLAPRTHWTDQMWVSCCLQGIHKTGLQRTIIIVKPWLNI